MAPERTISISTPRLYELERAQSELDSQAVPVYVERRGSKIWLMSGNAQRSVPPTTLKVLELLLEHEGEVVTYPRLSTEALNNETPFSDARSLNTHVCWLRGILGEILKGAGEEGREAIVTFRGVGYGLLKDTVRLIPIVGNGTLSTKERRPSRGRSVSRNRTQRRPEESLQGTIVKKDGEPVDVKLIKGGYTRSGWTFICGEIEAKLSNQTSSLFRELFLAQGEIVAYEELLEKALGHTESIVAAKNQLYVVVSFLRDFFQFCGFGRQEIVETIQGEGYRLSERVRVQFASKEGEEAFLASL